MCPEPMTQHAIVHQRRQRGPDAQVMFGVERRLDRNLRRGHVGVRVQAQQRHPRAVVESAAAVRGRADAGIAQQLQCTLRGVRGAGRRVADAVELRWESAEVVDGLRLLRCRHHRQLGLPVRRSDEDRPRSRQAPAELRPGLAGATGGDRVHRRAVRDEKRGQWCHGVWRVPAGRRRRACARRRDDEPSLLQQSFLLQCGLHIVPCRHACHVSLQHGPAGEVDAGVLRPVRPL